VGKKWWGGGARKGVAAVMLRQVAIIIPSELTRQSPIAPPCCRQAAALPPHMRTCLMRVYMPAARQVQVLTVPVSNHAHNEVANGASRACRRRLKRR